MEEKIITLVVLSFERAHILKSLLEAEEIECFLENTNLIQGAISSGVKVKIAEKDLEKALPLLEGLLSDELEAADVKVPPRLLLPVDFSDYSKKAAAFALDWAAIMGAEITVIHTYFNPIISTMPFADTFAYEMNMEELVIELEEKAKKGMKKILKFIKERNELLGDRKVKVKSELIRGVAEDEIIRFSRTYKPIAIIMGTRGQDQKMADLIGSVTAEVIERAKVPVLAIPEGFDYKGMASLKHVLYATDFMDGDFKAMELLQSLSNPLDMSIICAHVSPHHRSQWDEVKLQGLKEHFKKVYDKINIEADLIVSEDFYIGLEGYMREKQIDILAFTRRKRNLISKLVNPNIARKMLFHSTTPILVFND